MEKTLVPFDGSASAMRALQVVVKQIAGGRTAEVQLLNVQYPVRLNAAPAASPESIQRMQEVDGERELEPARAVLAAAKIKHTMHAMIGEPAESIARYAKEQASTEIVMGTRGMGSVANLVLGSVATKVVHLVDIPVTLVK